MSQNSVDFSGDPSGDELLDDLLTPQQENFLTGHSGTSRPSYAQSGTEWIDTTTTPWVVKRFDGSDDIIIGYINATTNVYTPAGLILDKLNATTAPTINDDNADGYSVGSKWVNLTTDLAYICTDSSTGAAVWKDITGSLTGPTSSVDSELALFDGTTGRVLKRASGTGYAKVVSGVLQTPAATIPLTDLANQAAQSVLVNATGSSAPPTAVAMAASTILARLASGNVIAASVAQIQTLLGIDVSLVKTVKHQEFLASGTYTPSAGMLYCRVRVVGGGNSGGGAGGNGSGRGGGGGGGSGEYAESVLSASDIGASKSVTVAALGGQSSLGSLVIANGGSGGGSGGGGSGGDAGAAGTGGSGGTGQIVIPGSDGSPGGTGGSSSNPGGGSGGPSALGGAGRGGSQGVNGGAGKTNSGGGGGGGPIGGSPGNGATGIVLITEYCSQ